MPRRSIRRRELETYQRELARSIDAALNTGQRGDGTQEQFWTPWRNQRFADAATVSERSVANWRNPDALMPPEDIQPLLKTFYGRIARFKDDRAKMERLWRLARGYSVDDDPPALNWELGKSPNLQGVANLVTLQTHAPVPWNDGTLRLSITLIISPDCDLSYRGRAITIGLVEALLVVESGVYQPAYKSRPSQRGLNNFEITAAGDRIIGPIDPETGMINGEPLGDEYLMNVELAEDGTGKTTISIYAARGSFRAKAIVTSAGRKKFRQLSINQDVVINALFHEQLRDHDDHNRAILARGTFGPRSDAC